MKQKSQNKSKKSKVSAKTAVLIVVVVMALAAGAAYYFYKKNQDKPAETTSTSETAQRGYQDGNERESAQSGGSSQGGVTDNNGDTQAPPADTTGTTSQSGAITVWQPVGQSLIGSGETIRGKATVPVVQFRVIDDEVGVIAQGELKVVDGVWSGIMRFNAVSGKGSIQVYSLNDQSVEENNISIPVTFGE